MIAVKASSCGWRVRVALLAAFALAVTLLTAGPVTADDHALSTEDLAGALSPEDLAQTLAGDGVTVSDVTYTGDPTAAGTFAGGGGIAGFDDGLVLSSGRVASVVGPNDTRAKSATHGTPGDWELTALAGFKTLDAASLAFDFVPDADRVFIRYVFGSEEYNEYVNSQYNDVFAFFVNGENCAVVEDPDDPDSMILAVGFAYVFSYDRMSEEWDNGELLLPYGPHIMRSVIRTNASLALILMVTGSTQSSARVNTATNENHDATPCFDEGHQGKTKWLSETRRKRVPT
jgi:hypothetical protein